jgi:hypothetical protein
VAEPNDDDVGSASAPSDRRLRPKDVVARLDHVIGRVVLPTDPEQRSLGIDHPTRRDVRRSRRYVDDSSPFRHPLWIVTKVVRLEVEFSMFAHMRFEPSGQTNDPDIRIAKSIVDYVFRWMDKKFVTAASRRRSAS